MEKLFACTFKGLVCTATWFTFREIGKTKCCIWGANTYKKSPCKSLLIAQQVINAVFWILCGLDTLASSTFMYSCIHDWTLTGLVHIHAERQINKMRATSPPEQQCFCHWELVKCLSDLQQTCQWSQHPWGIYSNTAGDSHLEMLAWLWLPTSKTEKWD